MSKCLYEPNLGFYNSANLTASRRGSFITSPEVGPLFGAVIGNKLNEFWIKRGRPNHFNVYDVGSNSGSFIKSLEILDLECKRHWRLHSVDYQNSEITPEEYVGLDLTGSVVIANELLDNLKFRIFCKSNSGEWLEKWVRKVDGIEFFDKAVSSEEIDELPVEIQNTLNKFSNFDNIEIPILSSANEWVRNTLDRNVSYLLCLDYGVETTEELIERGDWLRTYKHHLRGNDPLLEPGKLDITTDIVLDQLPSPDVASLQKDFLKKYGIDKLVEEGNRYWESHASNPNLDAVRMRSRSRELEALTDPNGLGSWLTLEWVLN